MHASLVVLQLYLAKQVDSSRKFFSYHSLGLSVKLFKMCLKIQLLILIFIIVKSECSKILFIHPSISKSTVLPLQALATEMAGRDHDVTFVSLYPLDEEHKNYRDIKIEPSEEISNLYSKIIKKVVDKPNPLRMMIMSEKFYFQLGNETLQSKDVRSLMDEKFDLLIAGYFLNEFMLGLAEHFKCPSIVFFSGSHMSPISLMVGNPLSPEGAPHLFSQSKELKSFGQRFENFMMNILDRIILRNIVYYKSRKVYE